MNGFTPDEAESARQLLRLALAEDLGTIGDRTSSALIPADQHGSVAVVSRAAGVLAGLPIITLIAAEFDSSFIVDYLLADGALVQSGQSVAILTGTMRSLLTAERTLLNFLQHLSGVATLTHRYVAEIRGTAATILDTRKTTPGWRRLEKYAVRMGGGTNHRFGLYDGYLIKDNHLAALGDPSMTVVQAIERARAARGEELIPIEVEVDTLEQLQQVLPLQPEIVLLDNMSLTELTRAVALRNQLAPGTKLEASGGVTLATVAAIARTGVDRISVGALTHSAPALDIGLDYQPRLR
jgi:nicotinate-nucleotide pyrophosphorylase (carboxylating)